MVNAEKLVEKTELLKRIEKKRDKTRKEIMDKLENMEKKKLMHDKEKSEILKKIKKEREEQFERAKENKSILENNEKRFMENILYDEKVRFDYALGKENRCKSMQNISRIKIVKRDKKLNEKMKDYLKQRNVLQNESILKKSQKQRRQIYNNILMMEREKKRKEQEKKLEEMGLK